MIRKSIHISDILLAAILVMAGFSLVLYFFTPVINSDDDVFMMYQLSGGFGSEPGNLLHFDHVLHPWLGFLLASLFKLQPDVNWYSWFLIFVQFISWMMLGKCLLLNFGRKTGALMLFLLFLLAGVNGLHSVNISSTSWVFSLAIMTWLVCFPDAVLFCFILFVVAGSIRLQIPLIVAGLFIPLLWIKKQLPWWKPVLFFLLLLLALFLLNLSHKQYYKNHIPGWEAAEKQRQDLFYSFNRPKDLQKPDSLIYKNDIEKAFYERLFLFDVDFPGGDRVKEIGKKNVRFRDFSQKDDLEALYWTWKAWRLYLLYLFIALFIAWRMGVLRQWMNKSWFPLGGVFLFYLVLFVFFKFTDAFFIGIVLMMAVQLVLLWPGNISVRQPLRLTGILFLLPMAWSLGRDIQNDKVFREESGKFICGSAELRAHRQQLFIATGDALPLKFFKFNEVPAVHSLENYIFKERVLTRNYLSTFRKFGIHGSLSEELNNPYLRFAGPAFPELSRWVDQKGFSSRFSIEDNSFHCLEVRSLLMQ